MIRNRFFGDNKEKLVTHCMLGDLQATKHVLNQLCSQTEGLECAFTEEGLRIRNHYTGTRIQHFQKSLDSDPDYNAENAKQQRIL
jgi:hypothetical protein